MQLLNCGSAHGSTTPPFFSAPSSPPPLHPPKKREALIELGRNLIRSNLLCRNWKWKVVLFSASIYSLATGKGALYESQPICLLICICQLLLCHFLTFSLHLPTSTLTFANFYIFFQSWRRPASAAPLTSFSAAPEASASPRGGSVTTTRTARTGRTSTTIVVSINFQIAREASPTQIDFWGLNLFCEKI